MGCSWTIDPGVVDHFPYRGAHRIMMTSLRRPSRRRVASTDRVRACPLALRLLRTPRAPLRSGRAYGAGRLERSVAGDSFQRRSVHKAIHDRKPQPGSLLHADGTRAVEFDDWRAPD